MGVADGCMGKFEFKRKYGWPTCAVCRKPVDDVVVEYDCLHDSIVFASKCHGKVDLASASHYELVFADMHDGIRIDGLAFAGEAEIVKV